MRVLILMGSPHVDGNTAACTPFEMGDKKPLCPFILGICRHV